MSETEKKWPGWDFQGRWHKPSGGPVAAANFGNLLISTVDSPTFLYS